MATEPQKVVGELWDKLKDSPFVMLSLKDQNAHSEPMTAQFDTSTPSALYFYTTSDNRLVQGLPVSGPSATAVYVSRSHDYFASVAGILSVDEDPKWIEHFWSKSVAAWYEGGMSDPKLRMLRFDLVSAELWKSDLGLQGKLKLLFGGDIDKDALKQEHVQAGRPLRT